MIEPGRIPMSDEENAQVDDLLALVDDTPVSMTRRDPGEAGPIVVQAGERSFLVQATEWEEL